jgi:hypothetical protein
MPKACALKSCLVLLLLLLAGAASAQDSQDRGEELRQAASAGDVAKVKALLDQGVDVNAANQYGGTALTFAARRGNAEMVKLLLERGADPNRKDNFYGFPPLLAALRTGETEVAKLLLAKTAEVDFQTLSVAASRGNGEVVKAILDKGRFTPEQLAEALVVARHEGKDEAAKALEAAGAKPPPPATFQVDEETLKSYVGEYEAEDGYALSVRLKDGKLVAIEEWDALDLGALDRATFRVQQYPALKVIFNTENGKVTSLTLDEGYQRMQLRKK